MLWVGGHYTFLILSVPWSTSDVRIWRLKMSESDVSRRQILTSKDDPRTKRVMLSDIPSIRLRPPPCHSTPVFGWWDLRYRSCRLHWVEQRHLQLHSECRSQHSRKERNHEALEHYMGITQSLQAMPGSSGTLKCITKWQRTNLKAEGHHIVTTFTIACVYRRPIAN